MKQKGYLVLSALILLAILLMGSGLLLAATSETMQARLAAVPHYARAYLRRNRPTVVPPTPPAQSALSPSELLSTRAPAALPASLTPTLIPTFTPPPALYLAEPTASGTATPAPTATPLPSPSATAYPVTPVADGGILLQGINHSHQMWNNCGPTTITMNFSYFGLEMHQREAAGFLKPNGDDKNVSPWQLQSFANMQGYAAQVRVAGTLDTLRLFLSNGFPVIVETWILPDDHGGMGHYRLLTGYDTATEQFVAQDSYFGPDEHVSFAELDKEWRVFNRKYIVVYRPEQHEMVQALLGEAADDQKMREQALRVAQEEATARPEDPFAWFNMGSSFALLGEMDAAASAFDEARRLGLPLRMLWYQFEPFEAYLATEQYELTEHLAYATAYSASGHEEAYYYQGLALQGLGQPGLAADLFRDALDYNPNFTPAAEALAALENAVGN